MEGILSQLTAIGLPDGCAGWDQTRFGEHRVWSESIRAYEQCTRRSPRRSAGHAGQEGQCQRPAPLFDRPKPRLPRTSVPEKDLRSRAKRLLQFRCPEVQGSVVQAISESGGQSPSPSVELFRVAQVTNGVSTTVYRTNRGYVLRFILLQMLCWRLPSLGCSLI